ncbi:hypothetical protein [Desulfovibrio inopinatus]|uniref:hypothetical protein n=1 Tax=Desulfovibrio inopinatus TaxID=102109 RepID=UPI0003FBF338|nr:hypothetical protein [Desulfovibrio inopinatus]
MLNAKILPPPGKDSHHISPTVVLNNSFADRESQPRAFWLIRQRIPKLAKRIEHVIDFLPPSTNAGIFDTNNNIFAFYIGLTRSLSLPFFQKLPEAHKYNFIIALTNWLRLQRNISREEAASLLENDFDAYLQEFLDTPPPNDLGS